MAEKQDSTCSRLTPPEAMLTHTKFQNVDMVICHGYLYQWNQYCPHVTWTTIEKTRDATFSSPFRFAAEKKNKLKIMTIAKLFALHAYALKISYTVKLKITKYLKL